MQLEHSFTVPTGIDEAWRILLDIEQIGPCMPGAAIDSVDGDDFTGTVKVKLGPINLTYKGKASFIEKDEAAHRAVIDARGRDSRGNGTAAAKVIATLTESGGQTVVTVLTDLDITGKPAQFGRGVMVDVGNKLIGQFADSLSDVIRGNEAGTTAAATKTAAAAKSSARSSARTSAAKSAAAKSSPAKPSSSAAKSSPAKPSSSAAKSSPAKSSPAKKTTARPKPGAAEGGGEAAVAAGPVEQSAPQPATDSDVAAGTAAAAAADAIPAAEEPTVPAPSGETAPAYAAPGGIAALDPDEEPSVNGHANSARRQPQREVEPIDLLQSAGPAIAKRVAPVLAPVAVALVVVLAARRRRRGKR